jgi:hypothetical protein
MRWVTYSGAVFLFKELKYWQYNTSKQNNEFRPNKSINLTGNSRVFKRWAAPRPAGYFTGGFPLRGNAIIIFAVSLGECVRIIGNYPLPRPVFPGVHNVF